MTAESVMDVFREGVLVSLKLSAPMLVISILVGLVIAVFQAATQIHEQTLTFVPKLLAIALLLLTLGSWMIEVLGTYMQQLFALMAGL